MSDALVEARDGILIITINRPDAKNAMNKQASELIAAALDRLDAENDLRVGIVTGAGGTFCSGMDLKGFLRGETPFVAGRGFGGITQKSPAKPLIAAVDGYALAGGLEVAIACDMIVANEKRQIRHSRSEARSCRSGWRPDALAQENPAAYCDGTGADW